MAEQKQLKTKFTGVTLKSFTRSESGISMSFSSNLTAELIRSRGWSELRDHEKSVKLEGALAAQTITLNGAGTLSSFEVSIEAQSVGDFEGVRRELEGKKGKGFRHELHFKAKSADKTGCRDLEKFILSIPEAKGTMIVMHSPDKPKQGELDEVTADADVQAELLAN
jgi:hypothetical protein